MNLQVVIPTKDFAFEPIINGWFEGYAEYNADAIYINMEKGLPPSGWDVRQKFTDLLKDNDCMVTFMDDDTLIPSEVLNYIFYEKYPKESILIFGQKWWSSGIKRLNAIPENMHPCKVDIGQLFLHSSFLNGMQWSKAYENDGIFIEQLYQKHSDKFIFINNIDTWYNALQVGKGLYNGQIITIA
jgi:hypothetical protein